MRCYGCPFVRCGCADRVPVVDEAARDRCGSREARRPRRSARTPEHARSAASGADISAGTSAAASVITANRTRGAAACARFDLNGFRSADAGGRSRSARIAHRIALAPLRGCRRHRDRRELFREAGDRQPLGQRDLASHSGQRRRAGVHCGGAADREKGLSASTGRFLREPASPFFMSRHTPPSTSIS